MLSSYEKIFLIGIIRGLGTALLGEEGTAISVYDGAIEVRRIST